MDKLDYIVFLGRFQPFHNGHLQTLKQALDKAHKVLVLCGSSNKPRDIRNPWLFQEREHMILLSLTEEERKRVDILPVEDREYNDQVWVAGVINLVRKYSEIELGKDNAKIGLIGYKKDHTSYYLDLFPNWQFVPQDGIYILNATDIRELYFRTGEIKEIWLPEPVTDYLKNFQRFVGSHGSAENPTYTELKKEYQYTQYMKDSWQCDAVKKYGGPVLVTTDAVVVCQGHVLMVKRRALPGKGLWAFPGGYVNEKEKIKSAMLRELKEETKLNLPNPVLEGNIKDFAVFDDPQRSVRGRVITHAYYIELPPAKDSSNLPKIKGSDDAEKAQWIPINDFFNMRQIIFEDHYSIGVHFL